MNNLNKKNPFKVPKDYFYFFVKKIRNKIKSNSLRYGFITPSNYFNSVENQISRKVFTSKRVFITLKNLYTSSAIAVILIIFIYIKNTRTYDSDIEEFFIEEYLIKNSTYDIANQFDLSDLNTDMFINSINSINSISIDDLHLIKIYEDYTPNLITNENE